jgi:hypothetical protein
VTVKDVTNDVEYKFSIRLVDGKPVGVIQTSDEGDDNNG